VHQEKVDIGNCIRLAVSTAELFLRAIVPLLTTKALWPEGMRWRVFLFEP
jgi:hypothetical protein